MIKPINPTMQISSIKGEKNMVKPIKVMLTHFQSSCALDDNHLGQGSHSLHDHWIDHKPSDQCEAGREQASEVAEVLDTPSVDC